ncbi:sulfatase [Reichenbachiella sp.]|uniref:sulfatase family protein n=1 Tax=Reichenbachiella sp. TaxID=2184521 RepID=UPI003297EEE4
MFRVSVFLMALVLSMSVFGQPNIVVFLADDMTWIDCPPYGNDEVKTPHIQALADQGMSFDNMFTTTAMCSPTRQQFLTGIYPARSGAYPNHGKAYRGVKSLAHHFDKIGYNVALIGKTHYGPKSTYPIRRLSGRTQDDGTGIDINLEDIKEVLEGDKPFFLIVAQNQPHGPLNRGDASSYEESKLTIPDYMIDTRRTRKELSKYYAEISYMDSLLGVTLNYVEQSGKSENTIQIFTSEQGSSFPFGKWTCYDLGLKTSFIITWKGRIQPGSRTSAMAEYVDIVPTLLDLAGSNPNAVDVGISDAYGFWGFDGKSFAHVLLNREKDHKSYVFGMHTTRGILNGSESYPVRSVRNKRFKYIQNLNFESEFSNILTASENSLYNSWLSATEGTARYDWVLKYKKRPFEELYDIQKDPFELNNLAESGEYEVVMEELGEQLEIWMQQQGDLGVSAEMKAYERQGRGRKSRH